MSRTGEEAPPPGLRVTPAIIGGEAVMVLSYDVAPPPVEPQLEKLTSAEREVFALLLSGLKNAEIAERRATTASTTSKQVDAVYRKLGVHGRAELAARFGARPR